MKLKTLSLSLVATPLAAAGLASKKNEMGTSSASEMLHGDGVPPNALAEFQR